MESFAIHYEDAPLFRAGRLHCFDAYTSNKGGSRLPRSKRDVKGLSKSALCSQGRHVFVRFLGRVTGPFAPSIESLAGDTGPLHGT